MITFKAYIAARNRRWSTLSKGLAAALAVSIIGLPLYLFEKTYSDYHSMVRASEALSYAKQVAEEMSKGYAKDGKLRAITEIKTESPRPKELKAIGMHDSTLRVQVAELSESKNTLELVATVDSANQLFWKCRNVSLDEHHLPFDCRQPK